jgi:RNA polymerase sigma-70 factor (ECF subfamily)
VTPGRPAPGTDEALMLAVKRGDVGRLGELFDRYHLPLFDFLSRTTGDRVSAEDLVQDVFVRVLKYRDSYRDEGCFEAWLYRIARNARTDHFKRRKASEPVPLADVDPPAVAPGPQQLLESRRDAERVQRALAQLPDEKRELLVLAKYRGLKYDRIAAILDIEVGAVKVRVHRAVKDLRAILEDQTWTAKKSATNLRRV